MTTGQTITALIVDDDDELRNLLAMAVQAHFSFKVIEANSGNWAIHALKEQHVDIILCDNRMPDGNGEDVYRHLKQNGLKIPFILVSADHPSELPTFKEQPPDGFVQKPGILKPLLGVIRDILPRLTTTSTPLPTAPAYCKIAFQPLIRMHILPADLYLKLSENHFVKVMNSGEVFSSADMERLNKKNIECAYFSATDSNTLLTNLEKNLLALATVTNLSTDKVLGSHVAPSMQLVRAMKETFGWDELLENIVSANVNLVVNAISNIPELGPSTRKLLSSPQGGLAEFGASIAFVSCGIAQTLGWLSDLTNYKLALAALLQDLPLTDSQFEEMEQLALQSRNESIPKGSPIALYMRHPKDAAALLRKWKNAPPDVANIISQHHERPDGTGFPSGLGYKNISALAAVQIVARDLVEYHHFAKGSEVDFAGFFAARRDLYSHGVFKKIINALVVVAAQSVST